MMLGNYTGTSAVSHCERRREGGGWRAAVGGKAQVLGVGGRVAGTHVFHLRRANSIAAPWQTSTYAGTYTEPLTSGLQLNWRSVASVARR